MAATISDQFSIIIHRTDLLFTRYATEKLSPLDIAPEQNLVVLLLAERSPQTQSELGAAVNKDKTNMTRLLAALERKGLVRRSSPSGDRRSLLVHLTPAGTELARNTAPIAARFQDLLTQNIPEADLLTFTRTLEAMNTNLQASLSDPKDRR